MRVNKWGKSLGVRFPSEFVKLMCLREKSYVEVTCRDDEIVVRNGELDLHDALLVLRGLSGLMNHKCLGTTEPTTTKATELSAVEIDFSVLGPAMYRPPLGLPFEPNEERVYLN
jgi:antitoxin component of MazEF toxin-antitoxin module